jgi:hypothetical protein
MGQSLLQRLRAQFRQALFGLRILPGENHLVLKPGLHLLARQQHRCIDLLLKTRGKRLDLLLQPRQLLLLLLQGRLANLPGVSENLAANVLVMKSAKDGVRFDTSGPLNWARHRLEKQLAEAKQQVQDIAVKAIEGASGARALSHINQIAMEQAKNRPQG